ncbi:hypothetical protein Tco_1040427 [Tanacetum coccineum]
MEVGLKAKEEKKAKEAKKALEAEMKAKKDKKAKEAESSHCIHFQSQAASTAPKGYRKIAMTGCVLALFAPNAPNAPPPFPPTRKRKST